MNTDCLPRLFGLLLAALAGLFATALLAASAIAAGPPFPEPQTDVVVYDNGNILSPTTEARATQIITGIEQRTGAEIVVYTQYKPGSTDESTEQDALALINQWGVGRRGYDDGLAIMWNTTRQQCESGVSGNGRVQLYAAPGYAATYLSNKERQEIFDNDMVPLLRTCDEDGALLAALEKIDAAATPEHANKLAAARIIDAAVGLILAPLAFVLLVGWAALRWLRYGKDPIYLDDPSILMPAPPPDLTAASGAVIWEGKATRRALTTAMLDLASRGLLSFREEKHVLRSKAGILVNTVPPTDPNIIRNTRRPLSRAEEYAYEELAGIADPVTGNYIEPDDLLRFGPHVATFNTRLESHVVDRGWFREAPTKVTGKWAGIGTLVIVGGGVALITGFNLPSTGVTLLGGALIAAGIAIILIARVMPARTMAGAMIYAMLAAYRRTLQATMAQSRSMQQVVEQAQLPWIETPDQAVVWGTALGLQHDVEAVLARSAEDAQAGVMTYHPWLPLWYGSNASYGVSSGPSGFAPGLFSSSAMPDFGGMMSVLGGIGNSPSSSGGSGGFGGGGGGGGGGGAGGGY